MLMKLKMGMRLKSVADETQVIVIRTPAVELEVTCGGHPLISIDEDAVAGFELDPRHTGPSVLGRRYVDDDLGLELLVTKAGRGGLFANGTALYEKAAKPLPASD